METFHQDTFLCPKPQPKKLKNKKTYKIIKRVPFNNLTHSTLNPPSNNMFDDLNQTDGFSRKEKVDESFSRFLKTLKNKKKNQSKEYIEIKESGGQFREYRPSYMRAEGQKKQSVKFSVKGGKSLHFSPETKEEMYQKHSEYNSKKLINIRSKSELISEKLLRTSDKKNRRNNNKQQEWAKTQSTFYTGKMGYINQNFYVKPLVERYGSRYFQFMLRNRYQDDIPPPPFIHQISSNQQNQMLSTNKFINEIRKINPSLNSRARLVVKGQKIGTIHLN